MSTLCYAPHPSKLALPSITEITRHDCKSSTDKETLRKQNISSFEQFSTKIWLTNLCGGAMEATEQAQNQHTLPVIPLVCLAIVFQIKRHGEIAKTINHESQNGTLAANRRAQHLTRCELLRVSINQSVAVRCCELLWNAVRCCGMLWCCELPRDAVRFCQVLWLWNAVRWCRCCEMLWDLWITARCCEMLLDAVRCVRCC